MAENTGAVVDIIIPIYRCGAGFRNILDRLLKQTVKPNHIFLLQTVERESELLKEFESSIISVHPVMKKILTMGLQGIKGQKCQRQILYYL